MRVRPVVTATVKIELSALPAVDSHTVLAGKTDRKFYFYKDSSSHKQAKQKVLFLQRSSLVAITSRQCRKFYFYKDSSHHKQAMQTESSIFTKIVAITSRQCRKFFFYKDHH